MIILGLKNQTIFVNDKKFETVTHHVDTGVVECQKGHFKESLTFYDVINAVYVSDANTEKCVSGYDPDEEENTKNV